MERDLQENKEVFGLIFCFFVLVVMIPTAKKGAVFYYKQFYYELRKKCLFCSKNKPVFGRIGLTSWRSNG